MSGFVKLSRDLLEWTWADDIVTFGVYTKFLLLAAWKETEYHGVKLERGELLSNQTEIAKDCGLTRQQVRTVLDRLKATNKITIRRNGKNSIIKVIDYDCETDSNHIDNHTLTTYQPDCNQASLFKKEDKKCRREEGGGSLRQLLDEAVSNYNSVCKSLEPLTGELSYHQAHFVEQAFRELHGVNFEDYFSRVEASAFLTGKSGSGFKASFDWLIRPENVAKVLSGKYDITYGTAKDKEPEIRDYNAPLWD